MCEHVFLEGVGVGSERPRALRTFQNLGALRRVKLHNQPQRLGLKKLQKNAEGYGGQPCAMCIFQSAASIEFDNVRLFPQVFTVWPLFYESLGPVAYTLKRWKVAPPT